MERLDLRGLPEKKENSAFRDCLDIRAGRAPRDRWAFLEQLGCRERKESGGLLDNLVPRVREVQMVHVEEEEPEDQQGSLDPRALLVMTAHRVLQERGALKGLRDVKGRLGQRDQMALQERMGCQVIQASGESQDFKERPVLPALLEWLDHREKLVKLVPWVKEDTQVPRDPLESKVCQDRPARRDPREIRVLQGHLGRAVLQAGVDSEEKEAYLALRVLPV